MSGFTIVVADDFSKSGQLALREALRRSRHAHVHVVHCVTDEDLASYGGGDRIEKMERALDDLPAKLWERIRGAGSEVRDLEQCDLSVHVRVGAPVEAIDQVAADYDADLIVVGTHSRTGVERIILGSVAEKLIKSAHCPVLVAREKNFRQVRRSERPEPPRPGEDLHAERVAPHIYVETQSMRWSRGSADTHGVGML